MRTIIHRLAAVVLIPILLLAPACGGKLVDLKPAAVASQTFAAGLVALQAQFVTWGNSGVMPRDVENGWQAKFKTMALAGKAINDAIERGDRQAIAAQGENVLRLVDDLIASDVVKLNEGQRNVVNVAMLSIRAFALIWKSVAAAQGTPTAGKARELDYVAAMADWRTEPGDTRTWAPMPIVEGN